MYILDINEDLEDESSVFAVGLVDRPAIERNWMAFANQKPENFKVFDEEKRLLAGFLMVADQPIYRRDNAQEYYVSFPSSAIEKIVRKHTKQGKTLSFNINHNDNDVAKDCYLMQSFLINKELGINTPKGFDEAPDGSWFGFVKVDNEDVWQKVKSGDIKGFSVEGYFTETKILEAEQNTIENLKNQILKMKDSNKIKEFFKSVTDLFNDGEPTPEPTPVQLSSIALKDGSAVIDYEGELKEGTAVMIAGQPAHDGMHELEDGTTIEVLGGVVVTVKPMEVETETLNEAEVLSKIQTAVSEVESKFNKQIKEQSDLHATAMNKANEQIKALFKITELLSGIETPESVDADPKRKSEFKKQSALEVISKIRQEQLKK